MRCARSSASIAPAASSKSRSARRSTRCCEKASSAKGAPGSSSACRSSTPDDSLPRSAPNLAGTPRARPTPIARTGRARSDAAPRLSREASGPARGAHGHSPTSRRAPRLPRRLAPGLTEGAAMADEPRPDRKLARHRGALLAGQEPRRPSSPADPRAQVGPRTSRPSRGMQDSFPKGMAVTAFRAPGSATVRSAPLSVAGSLRPITPGVIVSRALWSAGTRAHVPVGRSRGRRGSAALLEGARSVHNAVMYPCARGSWLPASPRPVWTARRARKGRHAARSLGSIGGAPHAGPAPRQT